MRDGKFNLGGKTVWKIRNGRKVQVQLPPEDVSWEDVKPIFDEIVKIELKRKNRTNP